MKRSLKEQSIPPKREDFGENGEDNELKQALAMSLQQNDSIPPCTSKLLILFCIIVRNFRSDTKISINGIAKQPKSLQDYMLDFISESVEKSFFQFVKNDPKINKDHL